MKNNKPSEWDEFTRRVYVKATVEKVYACWSTGKGISSWFLARCEWSNSSGKKSASEPAAKGDSYEWQWVANPFIGHGKILKADNKDHFDFSFIDEHTIVRIRLKEKKGRTLVELTQRHFHKKPTDRKKNYLGCIAPWSYHLSNLRSILHGGIDLRERDPDVKNLVNF